MDRDVNFKKIMYVHGFASSGSSGTVERLHKFFPSTAIVAPDVPVNPSEAITFLKKLAEDEQPDVIIGTSMGGMYTQQLRGFHRIIINPAFKLSESLIAKGFGRKTFFNPRKDGAKDFLVDGNMVNAFRELEKHQFDDITSRR
jgi:predicted esterase YcpF (UPF0227 family)